MRIDLRRGTRHGRPGPSVHRNKCKSSVSSQPLLFGSQELGRDLSDQENPVLHKRFFIPRAGTPNRRDGAVSKSPQLPAIKFNSPELLDRSTNTPECQCLKWRVPRRWTEVRHL